MKRFFFFIFFPIILILDAQFIMKETIYVTENVSLQQKRTQESENIIKWELNLCSKKLDKIIKIDTLYIQNTLFLKNMYSVLLPEAIYGFIENDFLYIFVYRALNIDLIRYDIKENEVVKKDIITVAKLFAGTVDNFGLHRINIQKYIIDNKLYFYITYGRQVGGTSKKLVRFDVDSDKVFEIKFSDKITNIKDEQELFKELDLNQNKNKIAEEIAKVLIKNGNIKQNEKIKYLDNIDLTSFKKYQSRFMGGMIYFFYNYNSHNEIIKYNNDTFEWEISNYTEHEIKDRIPKIGS